MDQSPTIETRYRLLPYTEQLDIRPLEQVDMLVIHCTELPDLETAREYGEKILYPQSGTGNSGHYYIDRDGSTELWIPELRVAHHVRGYNERSVGIELVNLGRYPYWLESGRQFMQEEYPSAQIGALLNLIVDLSYHLPSLKLISGHDDLDRDFVPASNDPTKAVRRKRDPGEKFPWPEVLAECGLVRYQPGS